MFEPLAIGNWTLNAEVSDDSRNEEEQRRQRREVRARKQQNERQRAERDDEEDVPARARRQIPEQDTASIRRSATRLTGIKQMFYTNV